MQAAVDGLLGLERISSFQPDLILLDIMLPQMNGFEICQKVREVDLSTPIIMLTAKGEEEDVVRGLNLGANDYMTKPFRLAELMARIRVHLRPYQQGSDDTISLGEKQWDTAQMLLMDEVGEGIPLTPKEAKLLAYFMKTPNRIHTRDHLLNAVWGHTFIASGRNVDRCVTSLRKKMESVPSKPQFLKTVRGVGYRLEMKRNIAES